MVASLNIKVFCFNSFRENCYLLWDGSGNCVIVDPGCYGEAETAMLRNFIGARKLEPAAVWLTHGHFDHLFGAAALSREYSIPVRMSPEDRDLVERDGEFARGVGLNPPDVSFKTVDLSDGDVLDDLPCIPFTVIATPGHTQGCVCFYCEGEKVLLSGDTLFAGAIGRTDLFGGDYDKEIVSIMDKLMGLPGDVEVLPGHGPDTTIAGERTRNPFLQPWGDPEDTDF